VKLSSSFFSKLALLLPLAILAGHVAWGVVRGTWSESVARNPASAREGVITQLYKNDEGNKQIRCARVIDRPIADVWGVITDYDRYYDIFPTLLPMETIRNDDGTYKPFGLIKQCLAGCWTCELHGHETIGPDARVVSWNQPCCAVTINRGNWRLEALDCDRTLLVYTLEAEFGSTPSFVVRSMLMARPGLLCEAVNDWMVQGKHLRK